MWGDTKRLALKQADVSWVVEFFDGAKTQHFTCASKIMAMRLLSVLERAHRIRAELSS